MRRSAVLLLTLGLALLPACRSDAEGSGLSSRLPGAWEVAGEVGPVSRNGQRYVFGQDGLLQISRPLGLGPASSITATYEFADDTTLVIESAFGEERLGARFRADTLVLTPLGTGQTLRLVPSEPAAP